MTRATRRFRAASRGWPWVALVAVATLGLWGLRDELDKAHMALVYLLIVLGGSASAGRTLGLSLAVLAFLCFNFFLLPPFHTLLVADPLDWLVLLAFLSTSVVATQLLYRAQHAADVAERRADEIDRLSVERVRLIAEAQHTEALREAARLKDALIASVSHDLRTPLTTIKALAHDLLATGDERAAVIEEEADRLSRFVSDLLDLSQLNSGALPLAVELTAAEDLLGAALQRVSGMPGGGEIRARIASDEPILLGRFDFVHSLRALVNLIENALKYSPAGLPVEVEVDREGDRLAFAVRDRGPGVPPTEREHMWEPFHRGALARPDVGGTGLGLAIARRLAEVQGGELRYAPRAGGGSVFTLLLPAAEPTAVEEMSL